MIGRRIARAQSQRILDVDLGFLAAPEKILGETDIRVGGGQIPVYRQGALELGNALRGPVRVHLNDSETKMSQRLFGRGRQHVNRERFGSRQTSRAVVAGVRRSELAGCESNPDYGVDVLWIERESALEQASGPQPDCPG